VSAGGRIALVLSAGNQRLVVGKSRRAAPAETQRALARLALPDLTSARFAREATRDQDQALDILEYRLPRTGDNRRKTGDNRRAKADRQRFPASAGLQRERGRDIDSLYVLFKNRGAEPAIRQDRNITNERGWRACGETTIAGYRVDEAFAPILDLPASPPDVDD
jgi:hypothetical protein